MTNSTMFCYAYGVIMKQGTAHAWNKVHELSLQDDKLKQWFESQYTISANTDNELLKKLDRCGL